MDFAYGKTTDLFIMQEYEILKNEIKIITMIRLYYTDDDEDKLLKFKPWLGDAFSFIYDFIMKNSIFPNKFGGDMNKHYEILRNELKGVHEKRVLELAKGSGSSLNFLPNNNQYTGSDISPGLLRKAVKNFRNAGFKNEEEKDHAKKIIVITAKLSCCFNHL